MTETLEQKNSSGRYIWSALLILCTAGFAVFSVKTLIDDHNRGTEALPQDRNEIVQQFAPPAPPPSNIPKVSSRDLRGPAPAVPKQVLGVETETAVRYKAYRNDALGFSASVPLDAVINENAGTVTAHADSSQSAYWTLTAYPNTTETLASLETQLRSSPSVSRLAKTTVAGVPALEFYSPNFASGRGFALVHNNRLYYLLGNFSDPTLLSSFKFF